LENRAPACAEHTAQESLCTDVRGPGARDKAGEYNQMQV